MLSSSVIDLLSPAWRLFSSLKVISAIKAADAAFFHSKSSVVDDRRTVCLTLTPIKGRECRGMEWNGNRLRVLWSERRIFTQRLPDHLGICKKTNCQVLGFVIPTPDLELMLKRISRNLWQNPCLVCLGRITIVCRATPVYNAAIRLLIVVAIIGRRAWSVKDGFITSRPIARCSLFDRLRDRRRRRPRLAPSPPRPNLLLIARSKIWIWPLLPFSHAKLTSSMNITVLLLPNFGVLTPKSVLKR